MLEKEDLMQSGYEGIVKAVTVLAQNDFVPALYPQVITNQIKWSLINNLDTSVGLNGHRTNYRNAKRIYFYVKKYYDSHGEYPDSYAIISSIGVSYEDISSFWHIYHLFINKTSFEDLMDESLNIVNNPDFHAEIPEEVGDRIVVDDF